MEKKYLFFDADRTILEIRTGVQPDVKDSFEKLKKNGHEIFLCTGRSRVFLTKETLALPFDGIISNMGGYIEYHGEIILDKEIPEEDSDFAISVLRENGLIPVMEGNHAMYYDRDEFTTEINWYVDIMTETLGENQKPIKGNEGKIHVNKISAKETPGCNTKAALNKLEDKFYFIYHDPAKIGTTIECVSKGQSKGLGIKIIMDKIGIDKNSVIVFGDSNNDINMFEVAGIKVAMGNSCDELKEMADYVTAGFKENGISKALSHFGLI